MESMGMYPSGSSYPSPELRLPEHLSILSVMYMNQDHRLFLRWLGSIPEQLSIHTLDLSLYSTDRQDAFTVNVFLKALGPSLEVFRCNAGMLILPTPTIGLIKNIFLRSLL
jgi:hypothetical protein